MIHLDNPTKYIVGNEFFKARVVAVPAEYFDLNGRSDSEVIRSYLSLSRSAAHGAFDLLKKQVESEGCLIDIGEELDAEGHRLVVGRSGKNLYEVNAYFEEHARRLAISQVGLELVCEPEVLMAYAKDRQLSS